MRTAEITFRDEVEALYNDHHSWLHGWLRHRLGCTHQAADLAQDTFVRLISSSTRWRFDTFAQGRAYLRTTAQNLCVNLWRRQEIERAWLETLASVPREHHPSAERQVVVLQALEELATVLSALSPKASRAFALAVVCDMTDDQVGAQLGVSGRMVRKYVAQAMTVCLVSHACQTARELSAGDAA